ncbi:MAG: hypothetical protein WAO02_00925 [Verrucomicrobiia bacterium]
MKEMNWLEDQLNSWKPRRPSDRIKRRLFPEAQARPELVRVMNWLAPATVCMLLALAAVRQENGFSVASPRQDHMVAMILSNSSAIAYLPGGSSQIEQNVLPATLGWTNHTRSISTVGFTPSAKPNE